MMANLGMFKLLDYPIKLESQSLQSKQHKIQGKVRILSLASSPAISCPIPQDFVVGEN